MLPKESWVVIYNSSGRLSLFVCSGQGGFQTNPLSPPEMLVDEDDEDKQEVGGHPQEANGGQEHGTDGVLLEHRIRDV